MKLLRCLYIIFVTVCEKKSSIYLSLFIINFEINSYLFLFTGLENICLDIEYMLGMKSSFYWRICWAIVTPVIMIVVFLYALITTEALVFGGNYTYPSEAYGMDFNFYIFTSKKSSVCLKNLEV